MARTTTFRWIMDGVGVTPWGRWRSNQQAAFLEKLMLSSEFSEDEADRTYAFLKSDRCTQHLCSKVIERALDRIKARDAKRSASGDRKAAYRGGGA